MRKALLHPLWCVGLCLAGIWWLRNEFGTPRTGFSVSLFLAACGYVCNLTLIPWICFSDWGLAMRKKKMGDTDVMSDPIFVQLMTFMHRYIALAAICGIVSCWAAPNAVSAIGVMIIMASAAFAAWSVMRWNPRPT